MAFANTANTNDCSISTVYGSGGADTPVLVMGWFMPTTLAANANLMGGTISGSIQAKVDATDSTLLRVICNTATQWIWRGSTPLFANQQWTFIAALMNCETTTDTANAAAWAAIGLNPPVEESLSLNTTGSGNIIGANATLFLGSPALTGTTSFIGVVGAVACIGFGNADNNHPLNINTAGAITADTKELCYRRYVLPFWEGNLKVPHQCANHVTNTIGTVDSEYYECSIGIPPQSGGGLSRRLIGVSNSANFAAVTASATSATLIRGPRAYDGHSAGSLWKRR